MGRLTEDPECRTTNSGITVTSFRIAVGRDFGKNETDFFKVTAWRQTAEFICKYFAKGQMICILGRLQNEQWEDKNGQKRVTAEIVADRAYFASGKFDDAADADCGIEDCTNEAPEDCQPSPFDD
jgi:single-strand DNA-binding protein